MYYLVQENTFREENYNVLIDTLERYNLPYEIVKVRPFLEDFEFKTDRKDVFCFGSVKMSRLGKKYSWYLGFLLNENHDYRVYSKYYKDNLLNYDSEIIKFGDDITKDYFLLVHVPIIKHLLVKFLPMMVGVNLKMIFLKSEQNPH